MELQEEFNAMTARCRRWSRRTVTLPPMLAARADEIAKKLPKEPRPAREELASLKLELQHLTQSFKI